MQDNKTYSHVSGCIIGHKLLLEHLLHNCCVHSLGCQELGCMLLQILHVFFFIVLIYTNFLLIVIFDIVDKKVAKWNVNLFHKMNYM
jgi:hypothetical protein